MQWYTSLSKAIIKKYEKQDRFYDHQEDTKTETVKLFKQLLKFEMQCACRALNDDDHPTIHKMIIAVQDTISLHSWKEKVDEIKDLDTKLSTTIRDYELNLQTEYSSQTAENTAKLLAELWQIRIVTAEMKKFKEDKSLANLLKNFGETNYFGQMRLNPERHPGTCEWFRKHPQYTNWINSTENDLLLVSAEPGCGKSVLSRCLIEEDLPSKRKFDVEPIVCYFFFKDNTIQKSLPNGLAAIIHQLLVSSKDALTDFAQEISSMSEKALKDSATLWEKLERVIEHKSLKHRPIYCVFDALDECAPDSPGLKDGRETLTGFLQEHLKKNIKRIQFLVTTRPYPNIVSAFRGRSWPSKPIRLEGEGKKEKDDLQEEINIVFDYEIDKFIEEREASEELASLIKDKLHTKGDGQRTYLWVKLVTEILKKTQYSDLKGWANFLNQPPSDVSKAYETLLDRTTENSYDKIFTLLNIIYIANEPLTLREANIAVHIRGKYDLESIKALGLDDKSFRTWIQDECGFFITEYDGRLFFIHQTAREFLSASKETVRASEDQDDAESSALDEFTVSKTNTNEDLTRNQSNTKPSQSDSTALSKNKSKRRWENCLKNDSDAHLVMLECCVASLIVTGRDPKVQSTSLEFEDRYYTLRGISHPKFDHGETILTGERRGNGRRWVHSDVDDMDSIDQDYMAARTKVNEFFSHSRENVYRHLSASQLNSDESTKMDGSTQASEALLTAFQLIETVPLRTVYWTSGAMRMISRMETKALALIQTALDRLIPQEVVYGKHLETIMDQAIEASIIRCSPLIFGVITGTSWVMRRYMGQDEGVHRPLDMKSLQDCQHSEDVEVLLNIAIITTHFDRVSPRSHEQVLIDLLRELILYEEQKATNDSTRAGYFQDLLSFIKFAAAPIVDVDEPERTQIREPLIGRFHSLGIADIYDRLGWL
jgi:pterin-4a-carbinolamine dehydratase